MSNTKSLQTIMKHLLMTVIVLFGTTTFTAAQTTPSTPTTPEQKKQAPQPGTMQQQQGTQQGWQWFDDNATRDMKLDDARTKELRDLDTRYRKDYDAMGATPWTHSDYQALTDRRNADIQRVLSPDQYKQWSSRSSTRATYPMQTPGTTAPKR
jgi:hypothetical protein